MRRTRYRPVYSSPGSLSQNILKYTMFNVDHHKVSMKGCILGGHLKRLQSATLGFEIRDPRKNSSVVPNTESNPARVQIWLVGPVMNHTCRLFTMGFIMNHTSLLIERNIVCRPIQKKLVNISSTVEDSPTL